MKIAIDNLDGSGALDYSGWVSTEGSLKLQRSLNAPSICQCTLDLSCSALKAPVRRGRVVVSVDGGTVLFTGYVATEPELLYAGMGVAGAVYRVSFQAISDEWLLDRQSVASSGQALGQSGTDALSILTGRVGSGAGFAVSGAGQIQSVGVFQPQQNRSWSSNAGELAGSIHASYRVLDGTVALQPTGAVTHLLSDGDGRTQMDGLQVSQRRELANDVTVSGEIEPAGFIAETFAGDGTTSLFTLSSTPFRPRSAGRSAHLITDSFDEGSFDRRVWDVNDPGSHFGFGSAGLTFSGGNGQDGQTTLAAIDAIEIGGSLVLEVGSVSLQSASDGVLCGMYTGDPTRGSCFAGYNVRQSGGSTVIVPLVNGAEAGTVYSLQSGHTYTLRVRVHSVEAQRVRQIYYAMVAGAVKSFGGGVVGSAADLVFDLEDMGSSSNTPATILYDGSVQSSPASCSFVPVNSVQLIGSAGYCRATQNGSVWVTKRSAAGVRTTQIAGAAGEGVDCTVSSSGKVTFLAGQVPEAGELITVRYRSSQRAIARLEDAASVAEEAEGGVPGTAQWMGKVLQPQARSSADCESAAEALLSVSTDSSAAIGGSYVAINPDDIWPGDLVQISRGGLETNALVRKVTIEDGMGVPELLTYHVGFASEWAEGLGLRVSEDVATDVILPPVPQTAAGNFLPDLQQLTLASATGTALAIDAGTAPPTGGGFEVRRRDGGFGTGIDQDLVLRSPVRSFTIPREAQVERYYVRMYDGSTPPVYSRFSSAIFTNIPVG